MLAAFSLRIPQNPDYLRLSAHNWQIKARKLNSLLKLNNLNIIKRDTNKKTAIMKVSTVRLIRFDVHYLCCWRAYKSCKKKIKPRVKLVFCLKIKKKLWKIRGFESLCELELYVVSRTLLHTRVLVSKVAVLYGFTEATWCYVSHFWNIFSAQISQGSLN